MSVKITKEAFLEKFNRAYSNQTISITEWNGFTKPISFYCGICNELHTTSDARQLLNKKTFCQKEAKNNKKWALVEYKSRLEALHGEPVEIVEYTGLSNPITYKCPRCEELKKCNPARTMLTRLSLCDKCYGVERDLIKNRVDKIFNSITSYSLITWRGATKKMSIQCNKCGCIFEREPRHFVEQYDNCPNCNSGGDKQKLDIQIIQQRVDAQFGKNSYTVLVYKGQLNKHNKIRCNTCNLIFETHMASFINASRGCPKCQRYKSKGEQAIERYLKENNICFESQKRFKDCNNGLSSFDFCVFDSKGQMYLIEVNGRQHYIEVPQFEGLELIQRRDKIKIDYCKEHNIPLIIIPYTELQETDIDNKLSFLKGSTTIPEGSKEQAIGS